MSVSHRYSGIMSPTSQHFYASVLFTALISRGLSLVNLIPHSPWSQKLIEHWDYASAMGICRTMMELRFAFYYLCVDECPRIEWECRWNIFNLHDCEARRKMFEVLDTSPEQKASFEVQADELRDRLRSNDYFLSLPEAKKRKYLRGQTAYLFALEDIGEKAGVDKQTFRWLYAFFSNHVHGLPMSFYRMGLDGGDRGRGLPTPVEERYTSLCLSTAASLLTHTRDEILMLFKGLERTDIQPSDDAQADQPEVFAQKASEFAVGQSRDLVSTSDIRIEVTRTSESVIDVVYYYPPTDEAVLRRSLSEDAGSALKWFDPNFWTVDINAKPATERMVSAIEGQRRAFKIDLRARTVSFKVEM